MLDEGTIVLGPGAVDKLSLPAYSTDVDLDFDGQRWSVAWHAPSRALGGEVLTELLQLYATDRSLVRLARDDSGVLSLSIVESGGSGLGSGRLFDLGPSPTTVPKKPTRRIRRRDRRQERFAIPSHDDFDWFGSTQSVGIHKAARDGLMARIGDGGWDDLELFRLRLEGERLAAVNDFEELMAPELAKVEQMPHQEATARRVLGGMGGRAILADEVGLGKTIEAGLIFKELELRGLVRRVLILCPATLREQWREELESKFDEPFEVIYSGDQRMTGDRLIMSLTLARLNVAKLVKQDWDLLIVDEAHKNGGGPKTRELLEGIQSRYRLFLTATPVQNNLLELHRIVEQLRPGTFASRADFVRRYYDKESPTKPVDAPALRRLVSQVMVRTTREQAGLDKVHRSAIDVPVTLSKQERDLYRLCTDGLRTIMTEPHDHLRRRSLAHRLTASPRSLAMTASKIADQHPNPVVSKFLGEVAEIGLGLESTSRQQEMLRIVKGWVDPKNTNTSGKALVFTQHYDTLEDLVRVLEREGISAGLYHGGLSASAKQKAVKEFHGRDMQVLVCTDAGAEGLNLQVANCVCNYDLPWNPMRIEQRIGRVHRLTQQRDTVYVANLFAKGTVDERVYRILHDKLRMFELLFGQVTTILGEIEEEGAASTFEGEVLRAVFAGDDKEMDRRLAGLADRVDRAYVAAQEMVADGGGINAWAIDRSHRDGLQKGSELLPQVKKRQQSRQKQVQAFVDDYLLHTGAEILFEETGFISARMNPELAERLDGREELHLAFGVQGLEHHRDAELCAAGSEVFEEIVGSLEELGDLNARMPKLPDLVPQEAWLPHEDYLELTSRRVVGPAEWAGQAVWRVAVEGESGDQILETTVGDFARLDKLKLVELGEGAALPETLADRTAVIGELVEGAIPPVDRLVRKAQKGLETDAAKDTARLIQSVDQQIAETEGELAKGMSWDRAEVLRRRLQQLHRLREQHEKRAAPRVEAYCRLLAVRLVGSTEFLVEERWKADDGREFSLFVVWNPAKSKAPGYVNPENKPIKRLALCDCGSPTDVSGVEQCPGCHERRCPACTSGLAFNTCGVCVTPLCETCLTDPVCVPCAAPVADPGGRAPLPVELGNGSTALVSHQRCIVTRPSGEVVEVLTPIGRAATQLAGYDEVVAWLGAEVGLVRGQDASALTPAGEVELRSRRVEEWRVDPDGGPLLSPDAFRSLQPDGSVEPPSEGTDGERELEGWASALVERLGLAPGPAIVVESAVAQQSLAVSDGALVVRHRWVRADGSATVVDESIDVATSGPLGRLRTASLEFAVSRLHRSFRVEAAGPVVLLANIGVSPADEAAFGALALQLGHPGARVVGPAPAAPLELADSHGDVELVDRVIEPIWERSAAPNVHVMEKWPSDSVRPESSLAALVAPVTHARLEELLPPPDEIPLEIQHRITETWRSPHGEAHVQRVVAAGETGLPVLHDSGVPAAEFSVDAEGHLHEVGAEWSCEACGKRRCGGCGERGAILPCLVCAQDACGFCRPKTASTKRVLAACEACGVAKCSGCGRDPDLADEFGALLCGGCRAAAVVSSDGDMALITLGSGAQALVSNDEVAITRASGDERHLQSEMGRAAQTWPAYRAVRDLLGVSVGVRRGGRGALELPSDEIELSRWYTQEWRIDPDGQPTVDPSVVDTFTWGGGGAERGSDPEPLDHWIAHLRELADLPPVPSLVTDELECARSLVFIEGWAVMRERQVGPVGAVHLVEHPMEVVATEGQTQVTCDETVLPVRRLHTSFMIAVPDGWLFVGAPGASLDEECAAERLALDSGLHDCVVGLAEPRPEPLYASPSGDVELLEREVTDRWVVTHLPRARPVTPDVLWSLTSPADVPEVIGQVSDESVPLWEALTAAMPPQTELVFDRAVELHERWASPAGIAEVERVIAPGTSGLPLLDDTGAPAAEFSVDTLGHLHEVDAAWECAACRSMRCRACGDEGQLGPCLVCGQQACGFCRPTDARAGGVTGTCVVCSQSDCRACGRRVSLKLCIACRRNSCTDCREEGACSTCRSLGPVSPEVQGRLPGELVAHAGVELLGASDRDAFVLLIKTEHRLELAVIIEGEVSSWTSAGSLAATELHLVLGVGAALGGVGDLDLRTTVIPQFQLPADDLVLAEDREPVLLLRVVESDSGEVVFTEDLGRQDGLPASATALVALAAARKPYDSVATPDRGKPSHRQAIEDLARGMTDGRAAPRLEVVATERLRASTVTDGGVVAFSGLADEVVAEVGNWHPVEPEEAPGWSTRVGGHVAETASAGGRTVALLASGPYRFIAVRHDAEIQTHRLDEEPGFPELLSAVDWLGTGVDRIAIASCVLPGDEPQVRVEGASRVSRGYTPVVTDAPSEQGPDQGAADRVATAAPQRDHRVLLTSLQSDVPSARLRDVLCGRIDAVLGPRDRLITVGFNAEEVWSTPSGTTVTLCYGRLVGEMRATIQPAPARVRGPILHIDRAGHLADAISTCPYCGTDTCEACVDGVAPCSLCAQPHCGRCAFGELRLCQACAAVERLGSLARRRLAGHPSAALRGKDGLHRVVVVPAGGGNALVTVERDGAAPQQLTRRLPAGVAAMCDRITKSTAFT